MLVLSALAVGKTFLAALLGTESWQGEPGSASLPRRLEGSRGDVRVQGREGGSRLPACLPACLPHSGLSSGLFLTRPRQDGADR